jgi:hypothetical protein
VVDAIGTPTRLGPKEILSKVDEYFFIHSYIAVADNTHNLLIMLISPHIDSCIGFEGASFTIVIDKLVYTCGAFPVEYSSIILKRKFVWT